MANGTAPFAVEWYTSDTTYTIANLASGLLDVGITYNVAAEEIAVKQGIVKASHYAFRDHFLFVGPPSNPAKINKDDDINSMFSALVEGGKNSTTTPPTRFLSRYDKSATNIKEALLFAGIGQVRRLGPRCQLWRTRDQADPRSRGPRPTRLGTTSSSRSPSRRSRPPSSSRSTRSQTAVRC